MGIILQLLCLYLPVGGGYIATHVSVFTGGVGGKLQLLHLYLPGGWGYIATHVSVFTGRSIATPMSVFTWGGGGGGGGGYIATSVSA